MTFLVLGWETPVTKATVTLISTSTPEQCMFNGGHSCPVHHTVWQGTTASSSGTAFAVNSLASAVVLQGNELNISAQTDLSPSVTARENLFEPWINMLSTSMFVLRR